jgi:RNA-directed DNA polymerase
LETAKSFAISKQSVWVAWLKVKNNGGSYGVDKQSISAFEENLGKNLYRIWNRMCSGSYFPPAVKGVAIPKKSGGTRMLGVPTVSDRVAQMVAKNFLEPFLEPVFHKDSYGYRPNKSALDAITITRQRCWQYPWLVEFDIKGLFDNIDHQLLLKALKHHCQERWVLLYVERWLKAKMLDSDGNLIERKKGTPQGGVVSPLLANLFMHYAFDNWVVKEGNGVPFCRYADDGILHCYSQSQAELLLEKLKRRMLEIGLEIHPEKSKIVYCKRAGRNNEYKNISFDFLGYCFRPRMARNQQGQKFLGFNPAVSPKAKSEMIKTMKNWKLHFRVDTSLEEIAKAINPVLQGWANYYGKYGRTELRKIWILLNWRLAKLVGKKYKKLRGRRTRSIYRLGNIANLQPGLFVHWKLNCKPTAG